MSEIGPANQIPPRDALPPISQPVGKPDIGTELLRTIDRDKIRDRFTQKCRDVIVSIQASQGSINKIPFGPLRKRILTSANRFLDTFANDAGEPNAQAIGTLVDTLIPKIDIVSTDELLSTARAVVDDSVSDEIVLYMPSNKAREIKDGGFGDAQEQFTSDGSYNSNQFMAKLVARYAEMQGKHVRLITDRDVRHYNNIVMIDDVAYSGSQHAGVIERLPFFGHPKRFHLYLAGSTKRAVGKIREATLLNPMLAMSLAIHPGRRIENLREALADNEEAMNFFYASGLFTSFFEESMGVPFWIKRLRNAREYIRELTLTITETKTPDTISFPSGLAAGLPRTTEDNGYPLVSSLNFGK